MPAQVRMCQKGHAPARFPTAADLTVQCVVRLYFVLPDLGGMILVDVKIQAPRVERQSPAVAVGSTVGTLQIRVGGFRRFFGCLAGWLGSRHGFHHGEVDSLEKNCRR